MDAGLAAVLGALAGSVATIGAALATGWAQRESARITARSEHRRERREPRQAVYREFVEVGSIMRGLTARYSINEEAIPPTLNEEERQHLFAAVDMVREKATDAALAGPEKVTAVAIRIERLSIEIAAILNAMDQLNAPGEEQRRLRIRKHVVRLASELSDKLDNFLVHAQQALDDDGSRK
jgi:hypothetical protein